MEQIQEESYQNMTSIGSSPEVRSSAQKTSVQQSATATSKAQLTGSQDKHATQRFS